MHTDTITEQALHVSNKDNIEEFAKALGTLSMNQIPEALTKMGIHLAKTAALHPVEAIQCSKNHKFNSIADHVIGEAQQLDTLLKQLGVK
jgi:hypothetical protein